eukprot:TRINITY_DN16735_c0_g1_i1.p3 TRINITY_DN16735_c0_g1~~TRINITY_DN16735_c0_g1_i1.p3  ORF type:complete len:60 (-),score=6.79 TRINITY_DN16735_c0_g1_i1:23-202(-)
MDISRVSPLLDQTQDSPDFPNQHLLLLLFFLMQLGLVMRGPLPLVAKPLFNKHQHQKID